MWQHSRPHPLRFAPLAFPIPVRDVRTSVLKMCLLHIPVGPLSLKHLKGKKRRPAVGFLRKLFSCWICCTWVSFTSEKGHRDRKRLARGAAVPLNPFPEFSLNLHWRGLGRFSDMPNLVSSVHVREHAVFLGDNKLLMPPTMWSSITVSDESAKDKNWVNTFVLLWIRSVSFSGALTATISSQRPFANLKRWYFVILSLLYLSAYLGRKRHQLRI